MLNESKTYLQQVNEAGIDVVLQPVRAVELVMVEPTEGQLFRRSSALYTGHEETRQYLTIQGGLQDLGPAGRLLGNKVGSVSYARCTKARTKG
jgi:hypothetical protein